MSPSSTVYRGKSGQWAFVLHRITGFLVFFFLLLHVIDVSLISRPKLYNEVHQVYGNVLLRVFEVGLLAALLYHALNGLRIVLVDFFPEAIKSERTVFAVVMFVTAALSVVGGYVIMKPFFQGHF
ncbi:MAG: succinate dehydrogenase / fumarate reductase, cytochrome b subunit [Actinomycetota bacterium]